LTPTAICNAQLYDDVGIDAGGLASVAADPSRLGRVSVRGD